MDGYRRLKTLTFPAKVPLFNYELIQWTNSHFISISNKTLLVWDYNDRLQTTPVTTLTLSNYITQLINLGNGIIIIKAMNKMHLVREGA
jgi:hypothetical protein